MLRKIPSKQSHGLIRVMTTPHRQTQPAFIGMLNLDAVVRPPKVLNVLVAQTK